MCCPDSATLTEAYEVLSLNIRGNFGLFEHDLTFDINNIFEVLCIFYSKQWSHNLQLSCHTALLLL